MEHQPERDRATLEARLAAFAADARQRAAALPPGTERDELLNKARQADTAANLTSWCDSPGLRPPK